ncbi:MAG: endopeptidase La [Abitibacteriaceae bacterium]|nr:endopeptidase La [Abditibacteriaceae bacterium]
MASKRKTPSKKTSKNNLPRPVPVVPMRGMVAFPSMVLPLFIGREKSVAALEAAAQADKMLLLVAQRSDAIEEPEASDLFEFGTLAEVMQMLKMPDGNVRVVVEGRERVRVNEFIQDKPFFIATVTPVAEEATTNTPTVQAVMRRLKTQFEQAVNLSKTLPPEALQNAQTIDKPGALSDLVASYLEVAVEQRQQILEALAPVDRAKLVSDLLTQELQVLEIDRELDSQVREGVNESQREYFLRERMKAIQEKLGDRDSSFKEADQLRQRVDGAEMSEEAKEKALAEIDRLEKMPPIAPEVSVIRTYVELMCDLPWNKRTADDYNINHSQEVLDEDHYALEKIKDRVIEFLAVRKLNPSSKGPILCFIGPPGVGKTSIGKSIARALGREFIRVSVGGIHDEAEIRGHRRTYIGSMPGRIISAMRRVKVKNPVFMLDEIDKLGHDFRGDPSSALLEALDPEQNTAFSDHYLEVPFDLSEVMFIATGNLLDPIPAALRDRLEVLRFPGYTEAEKHTIARQFLIPKQMKENGITEANIDFTDAGVTQLIRDYTREAGVRNLEREVGTVCRKIAREVAAEKRSKVASITPTSLQEYLGPRKFIYGMAQEEDEVGVAQGLAWTEVGGELMPIEVSLVAGQGTTKLTGNLGNVMKESCEAAMTYARAHADDLGIDGDWTKKHDAHIHVPSGAVPKDGPSAGVAIAVALVSAMIGKPVRKEVAMSGEISLRGRVMAIGGVKEKVLAAHRAGVKEILLPAENERDLDDIPNEVRQTLTFHWVDRLDDAIKFALVQPPKIHTNGHVNGHVAQNGHNGAKAKVKPKRTARKT